MKEIKFNDLTLQIHKINDLINENIQIVINSNAFIKGNFVKQFEDNFKKYSNVKHAICLLYTSPSPRDDVISRMPSSA